jgi:hypothetical protein
MLPHDFLLTVEVGPVLPARIRRELTLDDSPGAMPSLAWTYEREAPDKEILVGHAPA